MSKLLLLGGNGFIGKNLILSLFDKYEISVISRNIDEVFMKKYGIHYRSIDVCDIEEFKKFIYQEEPSIVINLISIVTAERDESLIEIMIKSNIESAKCIYTALKNYKNLQILVQLGSLEEYGNVKSPFLENAREFPNSPYSLSKQIVTNYFLMMNRLYNFPVVIWRLANIFGLYQNPKKIIPYVIDSLVNNRKILISNGSHERDFLSTDQFSLYFTPLLKYSIQNLGEIINVGSGEAISLKTIIKYLKNAIKSKSIIDYGSLTTRVDEPVRMIGDYSKLKEAVSLPHCGTSLEHMVKLIDKRGEI